MTINLRNARPGDQFRRRDGEVVAYEYHAGSTLWPHKVGGLSYDNSGRNWSSDMGLVLVTHVSKPKTKKPAQAKKDRDAEWLRKWVLALEYWLDKSSARNLRRIARRLEKA